MNTGFYQSNPPYLQQAKLMSKTLFDRGTIFQFGGSEWRVDGTIILPHLIGRERIKIFGWPVEPHGDGTFSLCGRIFTSAEFVDNWLRYR